MKKSLLFTSLALCGALVGTNAYAANDMTDEIKMFQSGKTITLTGEFKTCNKDHSLVTVSSNATLAAKDADKITNDQFKRLNADFASKFGQAHGETLDRFMENTPTEGRAPMTSIDPAYRATPEAQKMFSSYLKAALGFQKNAKKILGENWDPHAYKAGPYNYTTSQAPSFHCD